MAEPQLPFLAHEGQARTGALLCKRLCLSSMLFSAMVGLVGFHYYSSHSEQPRGTPLLSTSQTSQCFPWTGETCGQSDCDPQRNATCDHGSCMCNNSCSGFDGICRNNVDHYEQVASDVRISNVKYEGYTLVYPYHDILKPYLEVSADKSGVQSDKWNIFKVPDEAAAAWPAFLLSSVDHPTEYFQPRVNPHTTGPCQEVTASQPPPWLASQFFCRSKQNPDVLRIGSFVDSENAEFWVVFDYSWIVWMESVSGSPADAGAEWKLDPPVPSIMQTLPECPV